MHKPCTNPAQFLITLHRTFIMARIPEIVERLIRWQEWYFSGMSCGVKSPSMHVRVDRSPRIGGFVNFNEEEALQTDRAVGSLPEDLRKVVTTVYLDPEGRTMETNAKILHMSRMSLHRKLELADRFLFNYFEGLNNGHYL